MHCPTTSRLASGEFDGEQTSFMHKLAGHGVTSASAQLHAELCSGPACNLSQVVIVLRFSMLDGLRVYRPDIGFGDLTQLTSLTR